MKQLLMWLSLAVFFWCLGTAGLYAASHAQIGYYGIHPSLESVLFCHYGSIGLIITGAVFAALGCAFRDQNRALTL